MCAEGKKTTPIGLCCVGRLTPSILEQHRILLSTVGTDVLDLCELLYADSAIHSPAIAVLPRFLHHKHADEALEGVWGFVNKIAVLAPQDGDFGSHWCGDYRDVFYTAGRLAAALCLSPMLYQVM